MQRRPGLASPTMRSPARTSLRQHVRPVDDADREADEIELARLDQTGMLRHLAAEQRAARWPATFGDTGDDLVDLFGHEPPTEM